MAAPSDRVRRRGAPEADEFLVMIASCTESSSAAGKDARVTVS